MNRAERIFRIHASLKQQRPVTMACLREELGASLASIKRDLQYMRDFMRAPIVYAREHNAYRYDPNAPEFELPGLWFNAGELYALLATMQLLESVRPGLLAPYIGPLKARIRKLLEQSGHEAETVTQRIRLQPVAARAVDNERFGAVAGAVLEGRVVQLHYHGRERNQVTQRVVHPYRLIHYRNNWYLVAWCERAAALRMFALDCVRRVTETEQRVKAIADEDLDRYLGASFGIFTGAAKAWAVLRFTDPRARWVADEQWHTDQIGQWKDGTYELQVPYSDPRELLMDILKYGPDVEVVAPEALRHAVAERLRHATELYSEKKLAGGAVGEPVGLLNNTEP